MELLQLPVVMIENIFSYLSYDEIAKNRLVSRAFNEICMKMLNRGFVMIERRHAMTLKSVKAQLPRRESERRFASSADARALSQMFNKVDIWYDVRYVKEARKYIAETLERHEIYPSGYHPLSRHCDILTSIETRISMLNMTYSKFIDHGLCCFIPGKVIDEIRRVLSMIEVATTPPRAHEVLQELRDISSMAIEHFDDKISPTLRKMLQQGAVQPAVKPNILVSLAFRQEINFLRQRSILNGKLSLYLANRYKMFHKQMVEYKKVITRQRKNIRELTLKQQDQDNAIADLKKRIEGCDLKYSELAQTKQAAAGKAIAVRAPGDIALGSSPQQLRHFSSQIKLDLSVLPIGTSKRNNKLPNMKPRKPVIKLPSLSEDDSGPPAKLQKLEETSPPAAAPSAAAAAPSAGRLSPRTRSQCCLAKIRGITDEMRQMQSSLKRRTAADLCVPDNKKQKLD